MGVFDNFKFATVAWAARDVGFPGLADSASATTGGTETIGVCSNV